MSWLRKERGPSLEAKTSLLNFQFFNFASLGCGISVAPGGDRSGTSHSSSAMANIGKYARQLSPGQRDQWPNCAILSERKAGGPYATPLPADSQREPPERTSEDPQPGGAKTSGRARAVDFHRLRCLATHHFTCSGFYISNLCCPENLWVSPTSRASGRVLAGSAALAQPPVPVIDRLLRSSRLRPLTAPICFLLARRAA
ncbi:hypothetical protein N7532_008015 [Penicillium argentinense]|uniref:Uncharacterized protein n=1 Tax=Penicillium argentinense TaxID=1131581 RepID=A0A9W9EWS6_9EURO|nr:uncharacterized protein N7532_008015 [Penicillium argentinense]KAJ5089331.1 hypothetical protein N7532_008015 [Penicillium argentinense]